ncbi:MAG: universal stress protein [Desulfobacterales bacterium]|nr:universal stress protein [Desulfobacterales bacterium]
MQAQKARKEAKARLEEICARFQAAGIPARSHVYVGDPAEEIEKAARECQATMVVPGLFVQEPLGGALDRQHAAGDRRELRLPHPADRPRARLKGAPGWTSSS